MRRQAVLPGVDLPPQSPAEDAAALNEGETPGQWPPVSALMRSLFVFELDAPGLPPVTVLGLGVGDAAPDPRHAGELAQAQVVSAGRAVLDRLFPGWETSADGREYLPLQAPLDSALERLAACRKAGRRIVVLADGDPLFFGIGGTLARRWGPEVLRVAPGLSCLQEACARAGLPWQEARSVSLHGRGHWRDLNVAVSAGTLVCALTDERSRPDALARHLLDRGVDWLEMRVCENLGRETERIRRLSLPEAASREDFDAFCTVLLCPTAPPRRPVLGLNETELAVDRGCITKAPVRAAALSMLEIAPNHTVWDVGAGSGAVGLEACALAHQGCVVAVERSPGRAVSIRENRRRFGAANLEVHTGSAPECFPQLPPPDRIFVGGGCGEEEAGELLEEIRHCLLPGGRVVVSCVLMGTLHTALEHFQQAGWPVELVCVQAAQGSSLAGDVRLVPLNPVFLVGSRKPARE